MNKTMVGAVLTKPEVIEIRELPVNFPGKGEILLGIEAATTCGTDVKVFRRGGHPKMLVTPTPFGHEMAGYVAAAGPGVKNFREGDPIVVANSAPCFVCAYCQQGRQNLCEDLHYLNGAFAEFIVVPRRFVEHNTHHIPKGLSFEKAALTEPLGCVLHGVKACNLDELADIYKPEIIVFGAGPIGLMFVAALSIRGLSVTLADPNPERLLIGEVLGADRTICIERGGGQASLLRSKTRDGGGADVAIDATGVVEVWSDALASIRPGGLVNLFGGCAPGSKMILDTSEIHYKELTIKGTYHHRPETIKSALNLLAEGTFPSNILLSGERPIEETEEALRSMMRKETLKVVIKPKLSRV